MIKTQDTDLNRTIGSRTLALNAINLTIGGGIFVVPAIVAAKLGPASLIAYCMCAGLMILIMLCFAEIGSKITSSGGAYAYVEHAFGPYAGFLINVLFWFGYAVISDAAIANAMADMIGTMYPVINQKIMRIAFFVLLFGFYSYVNIKGVKSGTRLVVINTLLKLLPLTILIIYGLFKIKTSNLHVESWPSFESYGEMALILFFAFGGTESALGNSGEVKNPQKSIPAGIMMGLFGVLVFYVLIQTVAQGVLGADLATSREAPLAITAERLMGPIGFQMIMIGAIISIFGTLSGDILATSRMVFAGSKDGIYPKIFGKVHPKFKTPIYSILLFAGLIVFFASVGEFKQLALVSSSAILVVYLAVALATIKVKYKEKGTYPGAFKIPGGYLIPVLALGVIIWFLSHTSLNEIVAMVVFFVITSLFYLFYSRKNITKEDE
jgi:APA family basic amino acid/polyamine antiporter